MQKIPFKDQAGEKYDIPAYKAEEAQQSGLVPLSAEEIKDEQDQIKYGDQTAKALLYAGARGLTLGLSDQLLAKTGIVDADELKQIKERNELASIGGEVAGALAPALLSGGTGIAARAAAKTPAALAANLAERAGLAAGENVAARMVAKKALEEGAKQTLKQTVVKRAAEMGTAGLIEGALFGEAQLVTEEALGDAEFTAESMLAAAGTGATYGAGIGAALGAATAVGERAFKKLGGAYKERLVRNRADLDATQKAEQIAAIKADDEMLKTIDLTENQGVKDAVARLSQETGLQAEPTIGMLSSEPLVGRLESSVGGGASPFAAKIQKERAAVEDVLQEAVKKPLGAGEVQKYDAGNAIKIGLRDQIVADLGEAPKVFDSTLSTFGTIEPNKNIMRLIPSRIKKTDAYQTLLKAERKTVDELTQMLMGAKNLTQVNQIKKTIGQRLAEANRQGQRTLADGLGDLYRTAGRAEEDAIEFAATQAFGKDQKAVDEWLSGWKQAKKTYKEAYDKYLPLAEELGIKPKTMQQLVDEIGDATPEALAKKFLNLNDYNVAVKLEKEFPEAFDIARRQKLTELLSGIKNKEGQINLPAFVRKIERMEETQKKILFGKKYQKTIDDISTVVNSLPPNINPSGTDFANAFRSILSPIYQATEAARYAMLKSGSRALRGYFGKGLPTLVAAETAQNSAKVKIAQSAKRFFSAPTRALKYAVSSEMTEKKINQSQKVLDQLQSNPEQFFEDFTRKNKDIVDYMPQTSQALQGRMIAAASFLQSKFPQRDEEFLQDDFTPSRADSIRFASYLAAIEKPFQVIKQLEEGYIDPHAIEAMKTVYPKIFGQLQQDILASMPKKLTPTQRVQLAPILGAKVTPAMEPMRMQMLQNPAEVQPQQQQTSLGGAKNLGQANRTMSELDKTFYRR